ncbi:MAG: hypothetical protein QW390_01850 [Candidatus Bathyarchaeia archaeon]
MSFRSYLRLLRILVVVFPIIVGFVATVFGALLYSGAQMFRPEERPVPPGLLVFSSVEITSVNMSLSVIDLNFEEGRSDKTLIQLTFDLAAPLTREETIGFQFPYVVEKFEASGFDFDVQKPEITKVTIPRSNGAWETEVTMVYMKFGVKSEDVHYSINCFTTWSGLLSRTDYATYKFVVPIACGVDAARDTIYRLLPNARIRYLTQEASDHTLVMINAAADVKLVYPTPGKVRALPGHNIQMLEWDFYSEGVSKLDAPGSAEAIVVYFELGSASEQKNRLLFEAGIYMGLGVSLIFSGVHEALKYVEEARRKDEKYGIL